MYRHPIPVRLGTLVLTLNFRGLIQQIEWHWPRKAEGSAFRSVDELPLGRTDHENQLSLVPVFVSSDIKRSFEEYFLSGAPLDAVPWDIIDDSGWTSFQRQVYRVISEIPHGETRTYGWVAARVGNAAAGRAVGQALRANPLPILIPCHRVIASTSLGGFMGLVDPECSELRLKQRLISLEEEFLNPLFNFLMPSRELLGPIEPPELGTFSPSHAPLPAPSLLARECDLTPIRVVSTPRPAALARVAEAMV